ncbi:3,4-dihydroxy-2-butanone-4-phosphate synthase [Neoehrlichia mikurensis]|uniref:3,4-dihydroxy-2-butanone 4-phosphate synthase n=1 Tax=Neoehrlichia mikurensis TaxID=89586 RepID=A0A9Q9C0M7_9RICK|nr:3,4-dihydroxy-2-butanone-4-phosphate synthase [Neoehrlichia mikurensis]QXK92259.1 3,4-dihydroxy-2-butanone-4-phosphate synthase [Neoehrlichia mikurensis]QXK92713.1 3,4-dihydroxy-2-butanone-4-phosphate synthase [Neoehrlichia mikurensis]QXK93951.1 3,4-dihydroxy-2-butanone-4-phosphate synthase [Neoehrlichia mikurensis]UTO55884.1 3,4-dihydroxy-2-butanone-4-phosphate synthase [Neoehrlichia mikurensis]UTO56800.1 3,4-dihydroxy-2-butanone-4-phosphate synthase [Neoehrlichia mikurensis]
MSVNNLEKYNCISFVDHVIEDAANGKPFILVDDKNRENEGDLVVLADKVNSEIMNLMIQHGSGIVCLAMTEYYMKKLNLDFMPRTNINDNCAAFTTSIDSRYGITTGVSAQDRVTTILTVIRDGTTKDDFVTPGHVFPIIARSGGVLERPGHTEASVEIARLSACSEAAVVCELMNKDGTMSRFSEIVDFANKYNIKILTINRLIEYLNLRS